MRPVEQPGTEGTDYTDRLERLSGLWWKRIFDAQGPYRRNIRRLGLGRTLDVGCGIGRNLAHLGGNGVGVDHNATSIEVARSRGLEAYTVEEFFASAELARPDSFDSILAAHLLEHMAESDALEIINSYLPFVRPGGTIVFITPQKAGFASDSTHVRFVDHKEARAFAGKLGLRVDRTYSFPFPVIVGRVFLHNEYVTVARKPSLPVPRQGGGVG
jgi:2-polyprenyl-3-methyl-5-hydroxy-6-metoxy-1,4-benzoquinol methylase